MTYEYSLYAFLVCMFTSICLLYTANLSSLSAYMEVWAYTTEGESCPCRQISLRRCLIPPPRRLMCSQTLLRKLSLPISACCCDGHLSSPAPPLIVTSAFHSILTDASVLPSRCDTRLGCLSNLTRHKYKLSYSRALNPEPLTSLRCIMSLSKYKSDQLVACSYLSLSLSLSNSRLINSWWPHGVIGIPTKHIIRVK